MGVAVRVLFAIAVASATTLSASIAQADPLSKPTVEEARNHLVLGNRLYNVRSFEEAVTEYKAGALIEPAPVFDYNLGQCYRLTGKYQEAMWHYERFLARGKPQGELRDAVNGFLAQMRSELDKKAMTQKPVEAAPTSSAPSQEPSAPVAAPSLTQSERVPSEDRTSEAWYQDGLGWGLTGAGAGGLAAGAGFLVSASNLRQDANATSDQGQYQRLSDKASTRSLLGAVVGIGGAGLLVTGVIRLAMQPKPSAKAAGWSVGASRSGVFVAGTF